MGEADREAATYRDEMANLMRRIEADATTIEPSLSEVAGDEAPPPAKTKREAHEPEPACVSVVTGDETPLPAKTTREAHVPATQSRDKLDPATWPWNKPHEDSVPVTTLQAAGAAGERVSIERRAATSSKGDPPGPRAPSIAATL